MLLHLHQKKDMNKKLILPAEIKVCATCSFWDGERRVDSELGVVVVDEDCQGECLVQGKYRPGLNDEIQWCDDCPWEHLAPDAADGGEQDSPR
jgi:hypothetical protein